MIRIVIAEDQEMLLGTLGNLLNLEDDMEVVGQAKNGEEALTLVHKFKPDVCIMDIEMPAMSGLEAAESLISSGCKIIILTTFARSGYYQRALNANVNGYLLKDSPSEVLTSTIRSIMEEKRIFSSELMDDDSFNQTIKTTTPLIHPIGSVKNYFLTILEKMKLPTG